MSILKTLYERDLYPEIDDTIDEAGAFQRDLIEIAAERHAKGEIDRRAFLTALAGIGALGVAGLPTGADAAAGELVVVNWGGPAVDAYQAAFGAPFTAATGTKVVI
ncbi:MAG: ABC transporter substrate-binding protein, partial [Pseudomonadota bacterium]